MNIGEVLSQTWNIIWKNKILWLFGLFAGLAGAGGGDNFRFNLDSGRNLFSSYNMPDWVVGLLVLAALVLIVVFVILGALGRAGLIRGAWLADSGETNLKFQRLYQESQTYFGRVLLLGILIFAISLLLVFSVVGSTVITMGIALVCLLPLLCLAVPIFIALSIVLELTVVALVGEDLPIMDALRRAWEVFSAHLGEMIAIGLIVVIGTMIAGFLASLPLFVIAIPFVGALANNGSWVARGGMLVSIVLFILYLPILLTIRGIITAYVETAWTVTFRRLTGRVANSAAVIEVPAEPVL